MLYAFGFQRIGVVVCDLFHYDPEPEPGQEGPERGVRLELRMFDRGEPHGGVYSAQPISVGKPILRVDLLETIAGPPGTFDRTHHHPRFDQWEPGERVFVEDLSADPLGWVARELSDLDSILRNAGFNPSEVTPEDASQLQWSIPDIAHAVERLLEVARSEPVPDNLEELARVGWL